LKPRLSDDNIQLRLQHALSFLRDGPNGSRVFSNMHHVVHVDEKWFYLTKNKNRYYVYDDEEVASRSVQSKRFITKVMFMAAVARPRYDAHKKKLFDGKIGVWAFAKKEAAQRSSKRRARGTLETKPVNVDAAVYKAMILDNVTPAVLLKMLKAQLTSGVWVQQDNAGPHRAMTSDLVKNQVALGTAKVEMLNQPPNSPDFNVLDLGFFNYIQSLQHQKSTRTIDELIDAVENAFLEMPVDTLSKTFLTLQKVMEESMARQGSNDYKLPHMKKDKTIKDFSRFNLTCNQDT
jgi:hypothetical protein